MAKCVSIVAMVVAMVLGASEKSHTFTVSEKAFLLDGKQFVIRCGEIHFARVAPEYWRHRLQMIHACGFNTVCAYVFWNFHEQEEGRFDFSSPDKDVVRFCRIAQEEGLWVVLRPGPYTCAEWDEGGLPWWLLARDGIKMRSRDPKFLEPAKRYLAEVGRVLAPLQITNGGPILMVQVENEYGSYGEDKEYMRENYQAIRDAGFNVPIFACNCHGQVANGAIPELLQVVNFGADPKGSFTELRQVSSHGPLMCGEYYPAWFDSWGQAHHIKDGADCLRDLEYMLQNKASFSMYMAHGGSTFGWWAGCNEPFAPVVSSYDYDAPVSEAGWQHPTKFFAFRSLFVQYLNDGEKIPNPPLANPVQEGVCEDAQGCADVRDFKDWSRSAKDVMPWSFEHLGIGYGIVVYRAVLPADVGGRLNVDVRDLGIVSLDGRELGYIDRRCPDVEIEIPVEKKSRTLEIVVEPMGRYNFGMLIHEGRKGILGDVMVGDTKVSGWHMLGMRWNDMLKLDFHALTGSERVDNGCYPACRAYRFIAKMNGGMDAFLDMSGWKRGMVWLNGHALGRYWSIGPTQTVYAPGCWIRDGDNEVVVWDAIGVKPCNVRLSWRTKPILDVLKSENDYILKRSNDKPTEKRLDL